MHLCGGIHTVRTDGAFYQGIFTMRDVIFYEDIFPF